MSGTIEEKITQIVTPAIESMGLSLWGIRYHGSRDHATLQIFIESDDGVSADKCGEVMDLLSPALDAEDLIASRYTLEVSSPGLDRILFTLEQAKAYEGKTVKAELRIPSMGRKKLQGRLNKVGDDGILVIEDTLSGPVEVAFANAQSVRVVPEFPSNNKHAPKSDLKRS
ncbi:MAG: ribosome maturation factor RimP [Succinivibrio sp.]